MNINFSERKIAVLGYGVSGHAAEKLAEKLNCELCIFDEGRNLNMNKTDFLNDSDYIIVSPGIHKESKLYRKSLECRGKMLSELEFGAMNCNSSLIGITGTNGKTTVTELTTELIRNCNYNAEYAGNIGIPISNIVSEKIQPDFLILEISSFQLELTENLKTAASIVLNIDSDHMNRYNNISEYAETKFKMLKSAPKSAKFADIKLKEQFGKLIPDGTVFFNSPEKYQEFDEFLKSAQNMNHCHNQANVLASLSLLKTVDYDFEKHKNIIFKTLSEFSPGFHRMEFIKEKNSISFYNDSKATNPHAVSAAVNSLAEGKNICLILGGQDKNMDFSIIKECAENIRKIFIYGAASEKIYNVLTENIASEKFKCFDDSVNAAANFAEKGDIVLLSPACASMDSFENYKERGNRFKKIVSSL